MDSQGKAKVALTFALYQGDQLVLVDRQPLLVVAVLVVVGAEPVGKRSVHPPYGLAENPPRQRRAAAARVVRDHHGEPWIGRTRPQRRRDAVTDLLTLQVAYASDSKHCRTLRCARRR